MNYLTKVIDINKSKMEKKRRHLLKKNVPIDVVIG